MTSTAWQRQEAAGVTVLAYPRDGEEGTVKVSMRDPDGSGPEDTLDLVLTTGQAAELRQMLWRAWMHNHEARQAGPPEAKP